MPFAEAVQADHDLQKPAESVSEKDAGANDAAPVLGKLFSALGTDGENESHPRMLAGPVMRHRAHGEMRAQVMRQAQQGLGNHRMQRLLQPQATGRSGKEAAADRETIPTDSPGHALDHGTREFMEPRFGADFSDVRVHTDSRAAQSADTLAANAYTKGRDIYFGAGKYAPRSREGQHLLAHELTHTVQQGEANVARSQTESLRLSTPGEPLEREAEQIASRITSDSASLSSGGSISVADWESAARPAATVALTPAHGRLIQRDPNDSNVPIGPPTLDQQYNAAVKSGRQTGNWQDAAELLNGFNHEDIQNRLAQLTSDEVGYLHLGALDNPRVGPQSQVAQMTAPGVPRASTAPPNASQGPTAAPPTPASAASPVPAPAGTEKPVSEMTNTEKLSRAIDFAREARDPALQAQLAALKTPQAIFAMVAFAALFVGAQFTPVGWVADALALTALTLTVVFTGALVFQVFGDLGKFIGAINATTEPELKEAGEALAEAVATGGVALVMGLLTHAAREVPPGRTPFNALPVEGFKDAVTSDGEIVRVPVDTPEPAPANMSSEVPATPEAPQSTPQPSSSGRIISESRVGTKTVIKSEVGLPPGRRLGTERLLPRGVEVGRPGWERAHSQGQITGAESGEGILFAPEEVNQNLQRLGVEQFVSDLNLQKAADTTIFLTTETEAHPGTLALRSITYRVEASRGPVRQTILFEAEITVGFEVENPKIEISADQVTDETPFLKETPPRQ
jgi:hypothetical protein